VTEDVIDLDGERPTTGANETIAPEHPQPSTLFELPGRGAIQIAASELRVSQKEFVCVGSVTPHRNLVGRTRRRIGKARRPVKSPSP
jgi:hypothetical protein